MTLHTDTDPEFIEKEPKELSCGIEIRGISLKCDSGSDNHRKKEFTATVHNLFNRWRASSPHPPPPQAALRAIYRSNQELNPSKIESRVTDRVSLPTLIDRDGRRRRRRHQRCGVHRQKEDPQRPLEGVREPHHGALRGQRKRQIGNPGSPRRNQDTQPGNGHRQRIRHPHQHPRYLFKSILNQLPDLPVTGSQNWRFNWGI